MSELRILPVTVAESAVLDAVRALFRDYHAWLGGAVCATTLAEETAALPGVYGPPNGRLLAALDGERVVGCVAVRPFSAGVCEIKRLFVTAEARGGGAGRALMDAALDAACELGYREVVVTSLATRMAGAVRMYRDLGFRDTEPFEDHSHVLDTNELLFLRREL